VIEAAALRRLARRARNDARNLLFALRHCRNRMEVARAVLTGAAETTVILKDGMAISAPEARMLVPLLQEIVVDRVYDQPHVAVRSGDIVVDIGAHVGAFALHAASLGASVVHAYEPSPVNAEHLRRNVARNTAAAVRLVEAAVGASEGTARLGLGRYSVGNVLLGTVAEPTQRSVVVRTTTLAGIFAAHGLARIDYLKIDCEGSEGALLEAAGLELLRRVDRIALEYHDNWSSLDHDALAALLRAAGFEVAIEPHGRSPFGMIHAWRR
jgi:FkbM family methyltransferase